MYGKALLKVSMLLRYLIWGIWVMKLSLLSKIMPRNLDSSTTGIGDPYECKTGSLCCLLAQLTEMYTLCFRVYLNFVAVDVQSSPCFLSDNILNAIKNATGTSVIFPINIILILFFFVLTSVPNVGERFTKT